MTPAVSFSSCGVVAPFSHQLCGLGDDNADLMENAIRAEQIAYRRQASIDRSELEGELEKVEAEPRIAEANLRTPDQKA